MTEIAGLHFANATTIIALCQNSPMEINLGKQGIHIDSEYLCNRLTIKKEKYNFSTEKPMHSVLANLSVNE